MMEVIPFDEWQLELEDKLKKKRKGLEKILENVKKHPNNENLKGINELAGDIFFLTEHLKRARDTKDNLEFLKIDEELAYSHESQDGVIVLNED